MADTKLGGGVAKAVSLRSANITGTGTRSNVSSLVTGINDIIQSVGAFQIRQAEKANEEDKIRAVAQAETEHIDTNNAMRGSSYDATLNDNVAQWRGSGLTESEIRLKIKEYKFSKSVSDLGIDKGTEVNEASTAYFNTYNNLEMKALTPLVEQDRKQLQSKIANMNYSYVKNSKEDVNTKLQNIIKSNQAYGMGEPEAIGLLFQSAFDLARNGDESQLTELKNAKNSEGISLLDTIEGSKAYSEFADNLVKKKEYDSNRAEEARKKTQEATATNLYTAMIGSNDIHAFKLNIDASLKRGEITMSQHSSLDGYFKAITKKGESEGKAKTDRTLFVKMASEAIEGTLQLDNLISNSDSFEDADFEYLAKTAIQNGGINGVGKEESKSLDERIKNDSKTYGGASSISDSIAQSLNAQVFQKRTDYIEHHLMETKRRFITTKGKLPDDAEYLDMRKEVVAIAEKVINIDTVAPVPITKPIEPKVDVPKEVKVTPADKVNGRQALLNKRNEFTSKEEAMKWFKGLSEVDQKLILGI